MKRFIMIIIGFLLMISFLSFSLLSQDSTVKGGEKFRSVTLLNLKAETNEADFLKMFSDYNAAFVELGHAECKYQVWKERGDRKGKYKYIIEGHWPDQETYDKIHESEKYKELDKIYDEKWKEMIQEYDYSRYVPMN